MLPFEATQMPAGLLVAEANPLLMITQKPPFMLVELGRITVSLVAPKIGTPLENNRYETPTPVAATEKLTQLLLQRSADSSLILMLGETVFVPATTVILPDGS